MSWGPPPPFSGQDKLRGGIAFGAAACWIRAAGEVSREPALPPSAFASILQQRAYRESLRLRRHRAAVLLLYLLLPFFVPEGSSPPSPYSFRDLQQQTPPPQQPGRQPPQPDGPRRELPLRGGIPREHKFAVEGSRRQKLLILPWEFTPQSLESPDVALHTPSSPPEILDLEPPQHPFVDTPRQLLLQSQPPLPKTSRFLRLAINTASCQPDSTQCLAANTPILSAIHTSSGANGDSFLHDNSAFKPWRTWPLSPQHGWKAMWLVALLCLCFLGYCSLLAAVTRGCTPSAAVPVAALACCLVSAADYILLVFGNVAGGAHTAGGAWRATRLARPLLLCGLQHSVRVLLVRIVKTLPQLWSIILALFLSVALFDWLGVILFAGTGGHEQFHSFQRGCVSLLLVVTTVRLPQVLLCGYTVHEAAVLFVIAFYLITALLLGLFAAAFFSAFRRQEEKDLAELSALRVRYLLSAFSLLQDCGGGHVKLREWRLFYEALSALPPASFQTLSPEETRLFLQQQQQQQPDSSLAPEQKRLGTVALVSPKDREETDWLPSPWGSPSSRRMQLRGADRIGASEASRLLLQASPLAASASAASAAEAAEDEVQEAASLLRAWGMRERQLGGPLRALYRRQMLAEAQFALDCLGEASADSGGGRGISPLAFARLPAALAAVEKEKAAAAAKAFEKARTPRASSWAWGLSAVADIAVAVSLVVTFLQTRKFILTASSLTGEPIDEEAADGMPASCFLSHATSYWLQFGLSAVYFSSAGALLGLEVKHRGLWKLSTVSNFDLCAIAALLVVDSACLLAGAAPSLSPENNAEGLVDDLSRCIAFARVLRGLRIGFRINPLKKMVTRLLRAVRRLKTVIQVLLLLFYTYATVGMELFRGLIECELGAQGIGSTGPEAEGDLTDWGLLNFNDLFSSLVTLFLLTVNGWDDALKALVKHTSVLKCSLYFVSFYILTDTILLNLLVALVLEAYEQVSSVPPQIAPPAVDEQPFHNAAHKMPLLLQIEGTLLSEQSRSPAGTESSHNNSPLIS
ncbi:uncharacterized protein LOC113147043 [Cyclospora cayetanensis]|uniref:Uncharacterized protein LOC113147043 n=1 Tax=Cyclospora cayetanensis TaxID=88456 RepID=A0A6P6RWW8_9EIME|nr:uncharacterized protein LOC113147043 [Cyclospora cayetanensis]